MKKIYYVLLVFILVLISYKETRSDCPSGWFENVITVNFEYPFNGSIIFCCVKIVFCCRWNPDLQMPEILPKGVYSSPECEDCMHIIMQNPSLILPFINFIYEKMIESARLNPNCFPQCPPCDAGNPRLYYRLIGYKCLKWVNKPAIRLIDGTVLEWVDGIVFCDDLENKCLLTYACCCDWGTSPPQCDSWCVSAEDYGTSVCTNEIPQVPPPGKSWYEAWETECFTIDYNCQCP